jgi:hypothetical protein
VTFYSPTLHWQSTDYERVCNATNDEAFKIILEAFSVLYEGKPREAMEIAAFMRLERMYSQDNWTNLREAAELADMKNARLRERRAREESEEAQRLSREEAAEVMVSIRRLYSEKE